MQIHTEVSILPPSLVKPRLRLNLSPVIGIGAVVLALLVVGAFAVNSLSKTAPAQRKLAGFSTGLKGRNPNQRYNARLAARSIDGRLIAPGAIFSFNRAVKSWSVDQGYVKALVSYDGELVRAYGGGVCQTSTTLYNAALLAGLPILERHPHVFVPHYSVPGRDAAVAFPGVDLRFRNARATPIRIRAAIVGDRLEVSLWGAGAAPNGVSVKTDVLAVTRPRRLTRISTRKNRSAGRSKRAFLHSTGATGFRVVTSRFFSSKDGKIRRETLSDDTYPAMNRILVLDR